MKKLSLFVIGLYLGIVAAFSQEKPQLDSPYKVKKLTFEEANIVSSYYSQNGNNAAVREELAQRNSRIFPPHLI